MNRQEFMKQLEELLTGISPEEKEEALDFYTGYFEDAGEENEAKVIQELESPEKLAASIKAGLHEDVAGGVYTENGYRAKEETSKDAPAARRTQESRNQESRTQANETYTGRTQESSTSAEQTKNTGLTIILIAVIAVITSPIWLGAAGGILGIAVGALGVLIAIAAALFGITVGFFVGGAVCIGVGIASLFTPDFAVGCVVIGIGLLLLAGSMLALILLVLYCGKAIPGIVRGIVKLCQMPFHRKERGVNYE